MKKMHSSGGEYNFRANTKKNLRKELDILKIRPKGYCAVTINIGGCEWYKKIKTSAVIGHYENLLSNK